MHVSGSSENTVSWECYTAADSQGALPCVTHPMTFELPWHPFYCFACFAFTGMSFLSWVNGMGSRYFKLFWIAVFPHLSPQIISPQGLFTSIPSSTGTFVFNFPLNEMSTNDKPCFAGAMLI